METIYLVSEDGIMKHANLAFLCGRSRKGDIFIRSAPLGDIHPIGHIDRIWAIDQKNIKEILLDACLLFYPELFDYKAATRAKLKELDRIEFATGEWDIEGEADEEWQQLRKDAVKCITEVHPKLTIFAIDLNEKSPKFEPIGFA